MKKFLLFLLPFSLLVLVAWSTVPARAESADPPGIDITVLPRCRSSQALKGVVTNVDFTQYKVAVYVQVDNGWWTKPTFAKPLTGIKAKGKWSTDVVTGGNDVAATAYAAFLVPNGYLPPLAGGNATIPAELNTNAVASVTRERDCPLREISFSGYTWQVKWFPGPAGPGPNYFSDRPKDVYVDDAGYLHLKIIRHGKRWYSTEVINTSILGYGSYIFHIASPVDQLDPNAVLGLFTWDEDAPANNYREIDIEFSRWSVPGNDNTQYVVQPWYTGGNMQRFDIQLNGQPSTHGFEWSAGEVFFQSLLGWQDFPGAVDVLQSWTYTGADLPPAGAEHVHLNLWLNHGTPPLSGRPLEVIFTAFEFIPAP